MTEELGLFIALYTDEDVTDELASAVRDRGFVAQSAAEAGMLNASDANQLAYAIEHQMTLLTYNASDYARLAKEYAEAGRSHAGIIISSDQYSRRHFGAFLRLVLRLMNSLTAEEMQNRIVYLQQFK